MRRLEAELTLHLERANELGRQAKLANDAVEEELRLTRRLAEALRGAGTESRDPDPVPASRRSGR